MSFLYKVEGRAESLSSGSSHLEGQTKDGFRAGQSHPPCEQLVMTESLHPATDHFTGIVLDLSGEIRRLMLSPRSGLMLMVPLLHAPDRLTYPCHVDSGTHTRLSFGPEKRQAGQLLDLCLQEPTWISGPIQILHRSPLGPDMELTQEVPPHRSQKDQGGDHEHTHSPGPEGAVCIFLGRHSPKLKPHRNQQ